MSDFFVGQTVKLIRPALSINPTTIMPIGEEGIIIPPLFDDGIIPVHFKRFKTVFYADSTWIRALENWRNK